MFIGTRKLYNLAKVRATYLFLHIFPSPYASTLYFCMCDLFWWQPPAVCSKYFVYYLIFLLKYYCFKFVFSRHKETFTLKLIMTYNNLENYTFVSRTETLIFFLYLNPTETGKFFRFPAALSGKQRRPLPNRCKNRKIFWGTWEGRNSPKAIRCNLWQALGVAFLALKGLLKV